MSFEPCGVITLTTDFGHKGPFTAVMKGVMLQRFPGAQIIDLTHEVDVHFPAEAGFWLERAYQYFPAGSVHVAVVDPGVGTAREILVLERDGHAFVAPDNGLLAPMACDHVARVLDLEAARKRLALSAISMTFHGRDIFAPVGAALAAGELAPADVGPESKDLVPSWIEPPRVEPGGCHGVIVTVDNFGNLISNIDAGLVADMAEPRVRAGSHDHALTSTYGETRPGSYLALINSFGVVEIARAQGSAAAGLGLGRGTPVSVVDVKAS